MYPATMRPTTRPPRVHGLLTDNELRAIRARYAAAYRQSRPLQHTGPKSATENALTYILGIYPILESFMQHTHYCDMLSLMMTSRGIKDTIGLNWLLLRKFTCLKWPGEIAQSIHKIDAEVVDGWLKRCDSCGIRVCWVSTTYDSPHPFALAGEKMLY